MMTPAIVWAMYKTVMESHAEKMTTLVKRIAAIEKVEATGIELVKYEWDIPYTFRIKREQLPALRKVVGRVQVTDTSVPSNYDDIKEVDVTIKPMADEFSDLRFTYRKPYNGTGKCKVVETTQTYKTLVCER